MPGQPLTRLRRIRELAERAHELAGDLYAAAPERCRWEVCDEVHDDDAIGQAWLNITSDAARLDFALRDLIEAVRLRKKPRGIAPE
mgnify:CR=1 FL=1